MGHLWSNVILQQNTLLRQRNCENSSRKNSQAKPIGVSTKANTPLSIHGLMGSKIGTPLGFKTILFNRGGLETLMQEKIDSMLEIIDIVDKQLPNQYQ